MAGDVGDGYRGLDGRLSKKVQAELGILAVPLEQCVVDYLGFGRRSVRPASLADLSRLFEYSRSSEESFPVKDVVVAISIQHLTMNW
jgi:hypothetical protein